MKKSFFLILLMSIIFLFSSCADFFGVFTTPLLESSERLELYETMGYLELVQELKTVAGQRSDARKKIMELLPVRSAYGDLLLTLPIEDRSLVLQTFAGTAFELSTVAAAYKDMLSQDQIEIVLMKLFDPLIGSTLDIEMILKLLSDELTQLTAELQGLYLSNFACISIILVQTSNPAYSYTELLNAFLEELQDSDKDTAGAKKVVDSLKRNNFINIQSTDYDFLVELITTLRAVDSNMRPEIHSMMVAGSYVMTWLQRFYQLITGS
ncbi:MAG: hypothetical protein ACRC4W_00630 [Treponemataceae bacterium]